MYSSISAEHFDDVVEYECRIHGEECYGCVYENGIVYPYVQHNRPNRVLLAYRERGATNPIAWMSALYAYNVFGGYVEWEDQRSFFHGIIGAKRSEVDHALAVLGRLVQLEGAE